MSTWETGVLCPKLSPVISATTNRATCCFFNRSSLKCAHVCFFTQGQGRNTTQL